MLDSGDIGSILIVFFATAVLAIYRSVFLRASANDIGKAIRDHYTDQELIVDSVSILTFSEKIRQGDFNESLFFVQKFHKHIA